MHCTRHVALLSLSKRKSLMPSPHCLPSRKLFATILCPNRQLVACVDYPLGERWIFLFFVLFVGHTEEWKWITTTFWYSNNNYYYGNEAEIVNESYLKNVVSMAPLTRWVAGSRHRNLRTDEATDAEEEDDDDGGVEAEEHMFLLRLSKVQLRG